MLETLCLKACTKSCLSLSEKPKNPQLTTPGLHPFHSSDLALAIRCCLLQTHLPGYVSDSEKFKKLGVEVVVCVAVNDAFVMGAWGEANHASGKVSRCCKRLVEALLMTVTLAAWGVARQTHGMVTTADGLNCVRLPGGANVASGLTFLIASSMRTIGCQVQRAVSRSHH